MVELSDDELIYLMRCHIDEAWEMLLTRYQGLIRYLAFSAKRRNRGLEAAEIKQICESVLYDSVYTFRNEEGKLYTYVRLCMERAINHAIKEWYPLAPNQVVSLDSYIDDEQELCYLDVMKEESMMGHPDKLFELKESLALLQDEKNPLSDGERKAISMRAAGFSYDQIGKTLELQRKAVDNLLSRARMKLRKLKSDS